MNTHYTGMPVKVMDAFIVEYCVILCVRQNYLMGFGCAKGPLVIRLGINRPSKPIYRIKLPFKGFKLAFYSGYYSRIFIELRLWLLFQLACHKF